jgi:hypothetical protein
MDLLPPPADIVTPKPSLQEALITPISREDRMKLTTMDTQELLDPIQEFLNKTRIILDTDVRPHWDHISELDGHHPTPLPSLQGKPAREVIESLANEINYIAMETQKLAILVCKTKKTHSRKCTFLNRKDRALQQRLVNTKKAIKGLYQTPEGQISERHSATLTKYIQWCESLPLKTKGMKPEEKVYANSLPSTIPKNPESREDIKLVERDARRRTQGLTAKSEIKRTAKARISIQKLLREKPKLGNSVVTGKLHRSAKTDLKVLHTPSGTTTNPEEIKNHVTDYYTRKTSPPGISKTGLYLPWDRRTAPYPFEKGHGYNPVDPMKLTTRATEMGKRQWMHQAISDPTAFRDTINSLSLGKAPGPDNIINDVIKALPPDALMALHNMIKIMWATGITPQGWKCSKTILLYKNKGTPLEL